MKYNYTDPSTGLKTEKFYQIVVIITHSGGKKLGLYSDIIRGSYDANFVKGVLITTLPDGLSQELNFSTLESTISSMNFEATNGTLTNGQTLSEYIYSKFWDKTNKLKNSKVELYVEYDTTLFKFYTGYLSECKPVDEYETAYNFDIEDVTKQFTKPSLSQYIDTSTLLSDVPTAVYSGGFTKFARREKTGSIAASGIYNYEETGDQTTLDAWDVEEYDWWYVIRYVGHPIEFAKELIDIVTGTIGTNFDNVSFDAVKNNSKNNVITSFDYEIIEEIDDTLEFIRNQCFMPCLCYFYVGVDGKIYIEQIQQPVSTKDMILFDENNILEIINSEVGTENIVNFSNIKYDYNEENKAYSSSVFSYDDYPFRDSIATFGILPEENFVIEILGMNRNAVLSTTKYEFADTLSGYLFNRTAVSTKNIELSVFFEYAKNLKIGSFVKFAHTKIVDWKKDSPNLGKRGVVSGVEDGTEAIIDGSNIWGEYVPSYESNNGLIDYSNVGNTPNDLSIPLGYDNITNDWVIRLITFKDILRNEKVTENFLYYQNL